MDIANLLDAELKDGFKNLEGMEEGTDPYKSTVDSLTKLTDRAIEIQKLEDNYAESHDAREFEKTLKREQFEFEKDLKLKQFEFEKDLKLKQFDAEQKDREIERAQKIMQSSDIKKRDWAQLAWQVVDTSVKVGILIWGVKASFKFEETGTITSNPGRKFMDRIFPKGF